VAVKAKYGAIISRAGAFADGAELLERLLALNSARAALHPAAEASIHRQEVVELRIKRGFLF
jgi:hypothetical protein